jgi:hypothetical protein
VWLPTDKNMAGCDNCSFWVHDHCDPAASVALHAPSDIPFYCAPCKRQAEAHAKLTALRQAEAQLRSAQPRRPRSAYHLFSMELNKCGPFSSSPGVLLPPPSKRLLPSVSSWPYSLLTRYSCMLANGRRGGLCAGSTRRTSG